MTDDEDRHIVRALSALLSKVDEVTFRRTPEPFDRGGVETVMTIDTGDVEHRVTRITSRLEFATRVDDAASYDLAVMIWSAKLLVDYLEGEQEKP